MSVITFDVGLAHKLKKALAKADWDEEDINVFASLSTSKLRAMRGFLRGDASIVSAGKTIDCDAQPYVPEGWSIEEHQKGGALQWDRYAQEEALYQSNGQRGSKYIMGNKLLKELTDRNTPVLNANVLDYLLANPHLIPEEWKNAYIFFWGTIYSSSAGRRCVPCLYWVDDRWRWSSRWLGDDWHGHHPAAIRAA